MNCEEVLDALVDYQHRDLAETARQSVAGHLGGCATCAVEYCRLDAQLSGIAALLEEEPGREVYSALRARVLAEMAPPWWKRLLAPILIPLPIYQPLLILAGAIALWLMLAPRPHAEVPAPPSAKKHASVLVDEYDASRIIAIDPDTL